MSMHSQYITYYFPVCKWSMKIWKEHFFDRVFWEGYREISYSLILGHMHDHIYL